MDAKKDVKIYKALAEFQQSVGTIGYDSQGYGYKYASLSTIVESITPVMKDNNLGFTQIIEGETIKTIIFHTETGETLESVISIPQDVQLNKMNVYQVMGSAITYLRRYSLASILGIVTDEDNDAQGEQTKKQSKQKPNSKPKPTAKQWQDLVKRIQYGKTTIDIVKQHFTLSQEQEKTLSTL